MAEHVKSKRPYNSPRRQEQAAATPRAILESAQQLFEQQGYTATTMDAIAEETGVALKTVYSAFVTKSGLLRALWDLLLKGDIEDAPAAARPPLRQGLPPRAPRSSGCSAPLTRGDNSFSTRATRAPRRSASARCSVSSAVPRPRTPT